MANHYEPNASEVIGDRFTQYKQLQKDRIGLLKQS